MHVLVDEWAAKAVHSFPIVYQLYELELARTVVE